MHPSRTAVAAQARIPHPPSRPLPPSGNLAFDWGFTIPCAWLLFGLYLDGWAHHHVASLETFFTPWHAVLYSGYASVALYLLGAAVRERRRSGVPLVAALPPGYGPSLLGVLVFALGGLLDMLWHIAFGIEADIDALLSPTHLVLAFAGILMVTGPLRAALVRTASTRSAAAAAAAARASWRENGPAVCSLAYVLATATFFMMYAQPFARDGASRLVDVGGEAARWSADGLTIASVLLFSALYVALTLTPIARGLRFPPGALVLIVGIDAVAMTLMRDRWLASGPRPIIVAALVGAAVCDVLMILLRPSPHRPAAMRVFGALAPPVLFAAYFTATALAGGGLAWSVHLLAGTLVLAGAVGWGIAALVSGSDGGEPAPPAQRGKS